MKKQTIHAHAHADCNKIRSNHMLAAYRDKSGKQCTRKKPMLLALWSTFCYWDVERLKMEICVHSEITVFLIMVEFFK